MKILICSNRDFLSNIALNQLWPALSGHQVDLLLTNGHGKKDVCKPREIEDWEAFDREFLVRALPQASAVPGRTSRVLSFGRLARICVAGAPHEWVTLNRDAGLKFLSDFCPDLIISVRFGQIFKAPAIGVPRLGILNLHSGILPDYRGILGTFWAMLDGASEIGTTLHYVRDGTIDTGPIVGVYRLRPQNERSLFWNIATLYEGGTAMLAKALRALAQGETLDSTPQDASQGRYVSYPGPQEVERFLQKGYKFYLRTDYEEIMSSCGFSSQVCSAGGYGPLNYPDAGA